MTCDVAVHHLHLCDVDIGWFDAHAHLVPPLRGTRDRDALRRGVADGTIDAICSDHAPVDDDGKQVPFAEAEPGATGLELLLPLTLKWAAEDRVPLADALARITTRAGARFSASRAGDAGDRQRRRHLRLRSGRGWTRRAARRCAARARTRRSSASRCTGRVRYTLVAGQVVHEPEASELLQARGTRPIRKNSSFGRIAIMLAIRFDSAKKAAIAPMSQMSSSEKPCARNAAKSSSAIADAVGRHLEREGEHRLLPRRDVGLAVIDGDLVGDQRILRVDAQDRAVRDDAVEAVVGAGRRDDDHFPLGLA